MSVTLYFNDNLCANENNILNSTLYAVFPANCQRNPAVLFQLTCADSQIKVTRCDSNFTALQIPSPVIGCTPLGTLPNFRNTGKKDNYYLNQPCVGNGFAAAAGGKLRNVTASTFSPGAIFGISVGVLFCLFMLGVFTYFFRKQYRKKEKVIMANAEEETELDEYPVVVAVSKKVVEDDEKQCKESSSDEEMNSLNRDQTLYKRTDQDSKGKNFEDGSYDFKIDFIEPRPTKSFSIKRNGTLLNRFGDPESLANKESNYPEPGPSSSSIFNFETLNYSKEDTSPGSSSWFPSYDRPVTRSASQVSFTTLPLKKSPSMKKVESSFGDFSSGLPPLKFFNTEPFESSPLSEGGASLRKSKSTASKVSFAKVESDDFNDENAQDGSDSDAGEDGDAGSVDTK